IRLANQIVSSDILELIEISPEYSVHQLKVTSDMIGKTLEDLHLRKKYDAVVIAIRRKDQLIIIPGANERIKDGDYIMVIVRTANLKKLMQQTKD
ncbi:MAG TPA: TrkA C-terminal domain-containing protein, partial [archaeon]|nr:TrkA C-terminal domain-containing protein [archaeon]